MFGCVDVMPANDVLEKGAGKEFRKAQQATELALATGISPSQAMALLNGKRPLIDGARVRTVRDLLEVKRRKTSAPSESPKGQIEQGLGEKNRKTTSFLKLSFANY